MKCIPDADKKSRSGHASGSILPDLLHGSGFSRKKQTRIQQSGFFIMPLFLLLSFFSGCGEQDHVVVVSVYSERDMDSLYFVISSQGFGEQSIKKDIDGSFPFALGVYVKAEVTDLTVNVKGIKGGTVIAEREEQKHLQPGQVNYFTMNL